jgi:hypothetical protein
METGKYQNMNQNYDGPVYSNLNNKSCGYRKSVCTQWGYWEVTENTTGDCTASFYLVPQQDPPTDANELCVGDIYIQNAYYY